jgi:copper chaperone CopZ
MKKRKIIAKIYKKTFIEASEIEKIILKKALNNIDSIKSYNIEIPTTEIKKDLIVDDEEIINAVTDLYERFRHLCFYKKNIFKYVTFMIYAGISSERITIIFDKKITKYIIKNTTKK